MSNTYPILLAILISCLYAKIAYACIRKDKKSKLKRLKNLKIALSKKDYLESKEYIKVQFIIKKYIHRNVPIIIIFMLFIRLFIVMKDSLIQYL